MFKQPPSCYDIVMSFLLSFSLNLATLRSVQISHRSKNGGDSNARSFVSQKWCSFGRSAKMNRTIAGSRQGNVKARGPTSRLMHTKREEEEAGAKKGHRKEERSYLGQVTAAPGGREQRECVPVRVRMSVCGGVVLRMRIEVRKKGGGFFKVSYAPTTTPKRPNQPLLRRRR